LGRCDRYSCPKCHPSIFKVSDVPIDSTASGLVLAFSAGGDNWYGLSNRSGALLVLGRVISIRNDLDDEDFSEENKD